jgi:galactose oxidase
MLPNVFALLSAALLFHATNALNACPGTDNVFTGSGGIIYRVCPGTDLTGPSTSVTPKLASVAACAQLCDKSMNCFKAVYDTRTKDCHFKGLTGLDWVTDARFETVQAEQVNIASCPHGEWTYHRNRVSIILFPSK